jgi:hypothetical protein
MVLLRGGFNKDMVLFRPEVVIRAEKQSTLEVFCRTFAVQKIPIALKRSRHVAQSG